MGLKSFILKPYARFMAKKVRDWSSRPIEVQENLLTELVENGKKTMFGQDHGFSEINNYEAFKKQVPIRDYEGLKTYIEKIKKGEANILWPGKPIYFAKTSGTTSGVKYIPITKDSLPNHVGSARNAVFCYIAETGNASFFDGRMIFLSGSPELEKTGGILTGRLSGIVNHEIPFYVKGNQLPSWETNCIEDWETKVGAIVEETYTENLTLIGGIPSWVQMYFEKLLEKTQAPNIAAMFPNLQLYVYGGVNYEPYRKKFEHALGRSVHTIETYPASEGFIAFQDSQKERGLLLQVNAGIFYEFIPAQEVFNENPTRLTLKDVELEKNYALVLNTNAGLWGYLIGDTVKFVSKNPYRIVVTGRTKHFISAFGEHVIAEEVEEALQYACEGLDVQVNEFHVAPMVNPAHGELPYHEWLIDFDKKPEDMENFRLKIDAALQKKNIYYADLIEGNILQPLKITTVKKNAFIEYMKKEGKLGGQNKVARLGDNRLVADSLEKEDSREK
jgi:hypothetical protein